MIIGRHPGQSRIITVGIYVNFDTGSHIYNTKILQIDWINKQKYEYFYSFIEYIIIQNKY